MALIRARSDMSSDKKGTGVPRPLRLLRIFARMFSHHLGEEFDDETATGLGKLKALPLEVLEMIIREMDVKTCLKFRQVNRFLREIVTNLKEYKMMTADGLDLFAKLLGIGLAGQHTLAEVYCVLAQPQCSFCIRDTEHIGLPTLQKYCSFCLVRHNLATVTGMELPNAVEDPIFCKKLRCIKIKSKGMHKGTWAFPCVEAHDRVVCISKADKRPWRKLAREFLMNGMNEKDDAVYLPWFMHPVSIY